MTDSVRHKPGRVLAWKGPFPTGCCFPLAWRQGTPISMLSCAKPWEMCPSLTPQIYVERRFHAGATRVSVTWAWVMTHPSTGVSRLPCGPPFSENEVHDLRFDIIPQVSDTVKSAATSPRLALEGESMRKSRLRHRINLLPTSSCRAPLFLHSSISFRFWSSVSVRLLRCPLSLCAILNGCPSHEYWPLTPIGLVRSASCLRTKDSGGNSTIVVFMPLCGLLDRRHSGRKQQLLNVRRE